MPKKPAVNKDKPDPRLQKMADDLNYWVPQLRLDSWRISAEIIKWDKDCGFGDNSIDPHYEYSTIHLYDPETIPEDVKGVRDLEVTLVHELLHIRLIYVAKLSRKKKKKWPIEMAIETLAQALVANRRGVDIKDLK